MSISSIHFKCAQYIWTVIHFMSILYKYIYLYWGMCSECFCWRNAWTEEFGNPWFTFLARICLGIVLFTIVFVDKCFPSLLPWKEGSFCAPWFLSSDVKLCEPLSHEAIKCNRQVPIGLNASSILHQWCDRGQGDKSQHPRLHNRDHQDPSHHWYED